MLMKELTTKKEAELHKLLIEKRDALKGFRFGVSGSRVKNVKTARETKKTIARILTILNNQGSK